MKLIRLVVLLVTAASVACAPPAPKVAGRNANLITFEELQSAVQTNLYEAIHSLRPAFLRSRGRSTFEPGVSEYPTVYQDGQRFGDIQTLRQMSTEHVREVRYLNATNAATKYGMNLTAGVIEVVSR